jgi:TIR domain
MPDKPREPFIFIVYTESELNLAKALKALFEGWGCEAFFDQQDERVHADFRDDLRDKIFKCDVVVFLLSREFRWSAYCQSEAGWTMALGKPFIPIIVSPATLEDVNRGDIAPVLSKLHCISTGDPDFLTRLQGSVQSALNQKKQKLTELLAKLHEHEGAEWRAPNVFNDTKGAELREKVAIALKNIEENYRLYQPKQTESRSWPSLTDDDCKESIVGVICKSLEDRTKETVLIVVGVSLKYSLGLITNAIVGFITNAPERTSGPPAGGASIRKKLKITLVHMDSEAHILHAMGDEKDIGAIRENFDDVNWARIYETWKELCASVSIELEEPIRHQIDYIPPRVGILIDDKFLYAGRCSLRPLGNYELPLSLVHSNSPPPPGVNIKFNLDVGENEYLFYRRDDAKTKKDDTFRAMREFKGSVLAYRLPKFNAGMRPLWESDDWLRELNRYIDGCTDADTVVFISATSQRFAQSIRKARKVGATVEIYLHSSDPGSMAIPNLKTRLGIGDDMDDRIRIFGYQHSPTFRAVIIGDLAIGIQPYTSADLNSRAADMTQKLPLCLIITRRLNRFADLKKSLLSSMPR